MTEKTNKTAYACKRRSRGCIKTPVVVMLMAMMVFTFSFAFAGEAISRYTSTSYIHNAKFNDCIQVNGIDVSVYQSNLDWNKVKSDGIDFAIIRIGGRGYGSAGKMYDDKNFLEHYQGAKAAGLMIGIYYYSQCKNDEEAKEETDYIISTLEQNGITVEDLDLPIFMDYEIPSGSRLSSLSKSKRTATIDTWIKNIEDAGYKAGLYTFLSLANNKIDGVGLAARHYTWMAQYYHTCDFEGDYHIWQYDSGGKVFGGTGRSDMNIWYLNPVSECNDTADEVVTLLDEFGNEYSQLIPGKKSLANAKVSLSTSNYTYSEGKAYKPSVTVSLNGQLLTEGIDYKVSYICNTQAGTAYCYVRGLGDYVDYATKAFTIKSSTVLSNISVGAIEDRVYKAATIKPSPISVTESTGRTLKNGVDYTYTVSKAKNAGTANMKITFMGNYEGTKTTTFKIVKAEQKLTLANTPAEIPQDYGDFNIGAATNFEESVIEYESSNKDIVTVSDDGTVHITGHGDVTITVTAKETDNLIEKVKSFDMLVQAPLQEVTTKYTTYRKDVLDSSFVLGAATDGDGEITYEVVTIESGVSDDEDGVEEEDEDASAYVDETASGSVDEAYAAEESLTEEDETNEVVRVLKSGRVVIMGPGTAEIHVKASETKYFAAGEKVVTVYVEDVDADTKASKQEAVRTAVEGTTITSLKVTPSKNSVKLKWTKSKAKYGVDFYQVHRSLKKSSGFKKIYETANGKTLTYKDESNLKGATTYYYKVRGVRYVDGKAVYTPDLKVKTKTK